MPSISRVSFNFADKCNLKCKFCYIPFDGRESNPELWVEILERCADLGATRVSFGGGDPFMYPHFLGVLEKVRKDLPSYRFVHVDTNGLGLRDSDRARVAELLDLIGLPLDGPNANIHAQMRGSRGSYYRSLAHIEDFSRRLPTKVNTVVSALNVSHLNAMAELIGPLQPRAWALYEFWPVGPIASRNAGEFAISHGEYTAATEGLGLQLPGTKVEVDSTVSRTGSYFLVTHTGIAYATTASNPYRYSPLGSVFDDDVLVRWAKIADPELNDLRMQKRLRELSIDERP